MSDYAEFESKMKKTLESLESSLDSVRAGRANPAVLSQIQVEYYGTPTPIQQIASVSVPDPRTLVIQPWDGSALKGIEKAILASELGINPQNDGRVIRLVFPQLTEERRKELVKQAKAKGEEAKVSVRNIRRKAMEELHRIRKDGDAGEDEVGRAEKDLDKSTQQYVGQIDELVKHKEGELLEV